MSPQMPNHYFTIYTSLWYINITTELLIVTDIYIAATTKIYKISYDLL